MKKLIFLLLYSLSFSFVFSQPITIQKMFIYNKNGQTDSMLVSDLSKITFKKLDYPDGSLLDYEGHLYRTVIIGNQEWSAENLRTTRYNDGTQIENVTDNYNWQNSIYGAYCAYGNNESNVPIYGYLYNWHAVNTGKLAPLTGGWRVPTDADWEVLKNYIGASTSGTMLKSNSGWNLSTVGSSGNGTDNFGFTALPGGTRNFANNPVFGYSSIGNFGIWWSSSTFDTDSAWNFSLNSDDSNSSRFIVPKWCGYSVRFVRDL